MEFLRSMVMDLRDSYLIFPEFLLDRLSMEDGMKAYRIVGKWESFTGLCGVSGGFEDNIYFCKDKKCFLWIDSKVGSRVDDDRFISPQEVIPSCFVLYRLRCLFPGSTVKCGDGYKCVWVVS